MTMLHEAFAREVDPINDVRVRFEESYWDDYFDPLNGDWISDDYYRVINLSTKPGALSNTEHGQLGKSITHLNGIYEYIESRLGGAGLLGAYNLVAEQVNAINASDANRSEIPRMQTAMAEEAV